MNALDTAPLARVMWLAHKGQLVGLDIVTHDGGTILDLRRYFADRQQIRLRRYFADKGASALMVPTP
jgi:hypothetical protein